MTHTDRRRLEEMARLLGVMFTATTADEDLMSATAALRGRFGTTMKLRIEVAKEQHGAEWYLHVKVPRVGEF